MNLFGRMILFNSLRESLKTRLLINETIKQIPDVLKVMLRIIFQIMTTKDQPMNCPQKL